MSEIESRDPMHAELDAIEEKEWIDSLDYVVKHGGADRVRDLLRALQRRAAESGIHLPYSANTPYVNTIARHEQPRFPGRARGTPRWALAMARARARSAAGSMARAPPATLTKTS